MGFLDQTFKINNNPHKTFDLLIKRHSQNTNSFKESDSKKNNNFLK